MKAIQYITGVAAVALTLTSLPSCDDYLTVESPDKLTSSTYWRNEADAMAGLAAAYSQLEYYIDTWEFAEVKWPVEAYREDIVEMGADARNYPNWVELSNFSYTNGNSQVSSYWWNNYKGASFANQVIEKVAEIPDESIAPATRDNIVREARFLRAYYHLKLILNFREIIVSDRYITSQAELSKPLSSRPEAWDFIMSDLREATALPASYDNDNLGRATCGAAWAYLGFAALTRAYEEADKRDSYLAQAVEALSQVKGYELVGDYWSMFNGSNKNSAESIFELQTSMSSANGANYRTQLHRWIGVEELWGWDEILPSQFLMDEFRKEGETATTGRYDSRLYATITFRCPYWNDAEAGHLYGSTYDEWFGSADKPAFIKFMPADMDGMDANYCAINIPLMRYSNVLLLEAEALNELGRTAEALPLINRVRDVHGSMPAVSGLSQQQTREQIEHERILEFPLENWRWYDLRRWGKLSGAMQAAGRTKYSEEKNAFYPVPLTELNANEALRK